MACARNERTSLFRPGFTLLEVATVLGLLSLLMSITVVSFQTYRKQARTSEAVANVHAISSLERGRPDGFVACEASPAEVPPGSEADWEPSEGFRELGFNPGRSTRFQYEVTLEGGNFVVRARGDLDGDGETSLFELRSDDPDIRVERHVE